MIQVIYDRENTAVEVRGHANWAAPGEDLVCAGVTTLVLTLQNYVFTWGGYCRKESGLALIRCPAAGSEGMVAICGGFRMLADLFPQYVSFRWRDREENEDLLK